MTVHIKSGINSKLMRKVCFVIFSMYLCFIINVNVFAENEYYNEETGYEVFIEDDANLLSDNEEELLLNEMIKITEYGSVAFKSIDMNATSTANYIKNYYYDMFGSGSGTVFLIDMDDRNIWIYSNGDIYDVVTSSYADIITDNVYEYASDGDYYECADKAFSQILTLLEGKEIAQPMKYISNILLALVLAFLINYIIVRSVSRTKKVKEGEILQYINHQYQFLNPSIEFVCTTKEYSPQSDGGSGGGGGGGSSGGGGGGGGGGHSF